MEYGLQLYSVRDLAQKDLAQALRQVAALGYTSVEFAGFFGHSAEDVVRMLEENSLSVSGAHVGWEEISPARIGDTVAYHKAIGNTTLIIPWGDYSTAEKLDAAIDALNAAQSILEAEGMMLGYHNHAFEYQFTPYGALPYREIEERTSVMLEIDTYWVYAAGIDPIETLKRLGDRVRVIHVKDGLVDGTGRALGEGTAPVEQVVAYAQEQGIPMVVESEDLDPTGIEEVARCMRYLKSLDAQASRRH